MKKIILVVIAVSAIAAVAQAWDNNDLLQFQQNIQGSIEMIESTLPDPKGIQKKEIYKACIKSKRGLFSMAMADEWIKINKFGSPEVSNGFAYGIAYSIILGCYEEVSDSKKP